MAIFGKRELAYVLTAVIIVIITGIVGAMLFHTLYGPWDISIMTLYFAFLIVVMSIKYSGSYPPLGAGFLFMALALPATIVYVVLLYMSSYGILSYLWIGIIFYMTFMEVFAFIEWYKNRDTFRLRVKDGVTKKDIIKGLKKAHKKPREKLDAIVYEGGEVRMEKHFGRDYIVIKPTSPEDIGDLFGKFLRD